MSNTAIAVTRFRTPTIEGGWMLLDACPATAHKAAVSAYTPSTDVRNAAQGGAGAWRPPV